MTIESMTTAQLVAEYNRLNPEKPVKKFSDRATAIKRVYAALGQQPSGFPPAAEPAPAAAPEPESNAAPQPAPAPAVVQDAASKPPKAKRPNKRPPATGFKATSGDATAPRPKSKRAQLLAMLQRPEGVTQEAAER